MSFKKIQGITIEIGGDTTQLGKALKALDNQIDYSQKNLKEVERLLKYDPTNTNLLAQRHEYLGNEIEVVRKKLDALKQAQADVENRLAAGEIDKDAYNKFQREIEATEEKLKYLEKQAKSTGEAVAEHLGEKISDASEKMEKAGKGLLAVTAGLTALGAKSVEAANSFESSMSRAAGALDMSVEQMGELSDLALQMGQDTIFSASEAADAITELAKGGLNEAQIKAGALVATMDLAASSGMDMASAANIVVQTMGGFGLAAEESAVAVNALAGAAAASSTDVEPLTQGLAQVAAQAKNAGWNVQDTTAVLAMFADAGIVGSDAGTSLKTALQRLAAPTDKAADMIEELGIKTRDGNGNLLQAGDLAEELKAKLGALEPATRDAALQTIFGADAMRAATILMNSGSEAIEKYTDATYDMEAASRLANSQLGEGELAIEQMKGSIETAMITIGKQLAPIVTDVVNDVTDLVNGFAELDEETQRTIITFGGIAAAAGPVLIGISKITSAIGVLVSNPMVGGIALAATAFGTLAAAVELTKTETELFADQVEATNTMIHREADAVNAAKTAREESARQIEAEFGYYDRLYDELQTIVDANGQIKDGYEDRAATITGILSDALDVEIEIVDGVIQKYDELKGSIDGVIAAKKADAFLSAYEDDYRTAIENQEDSLKKLYEATEQYNAILERKGELEEQITKIEEKYGPKAERTAYAQQLCTRETLNLKLELQQLEETLVVAEDSMDTARMTHEDYMSTIKNYEGVMSGVASGDVEVLNSAIQDLSAGLLTAETANRESLERQYVGFVENLRATEQALREGWPGVTQESVDQARALVDKSLTELNKLAPETESVIQDTGSAIVAGFNYKMPDITRAADEIMNGIEAVFSEAPDTGYYLAEGVAKGIQNHSWAVSDAAGAMAQRALDRMATMLEINSPSKKGEKLGAYTGKGFANGLEDEIALVQKSAGGLAEAAIRQLKDEVSSTRYNRQVLLQPAKQAQPITLIQNTYLGSKLIANAVTENVISNMSSQQELEAIYKGWSNV